MFKEILIWIGLFGFFFFGVYTTTIAIINIENYNDFLLFLILFGALGTIIGIITSKKIKSYIVSNDRMDDNYFNIIILIVMGFIGITLLTSQMLNSNFSTLEKYENAIILEKIHYDGGYKKVERNILILNIDGKMTKILCKKNYWQKKHVGDFSKICIYKSPIGFDYIKIVDIQ